QRVEVPARSEAGQEVAGDQPDDRCALHAGPAGRCRVHVLEPEVEQPPGPVADGAPDGDRLVDRVERGEQALLELGLACRHVPRKHRRTGGPERVRGRGRRGGHWAPALASDWLREGSYGSGRAGAEGSGAATARRGGSRRPGSYQFLYKASSIIYQLNRARVSTMPNADGATPHRGRPRRAAIDAAIVRAAVDLMTEVGVQGTTLSAVAERAGVARATVYLRWPSRSALIGAAARAAVGGAVRPLTEDIEENIRVGAAFVQRVFELPATPVVLPEIIRSVLANPPEIRFDAVAPRRKAFARIYADGAATAGLDPTIDPHLPFDIMLGTAIAHV